MRLKLTLSQSKPRQFIPWNYHYAVSSFIYRTIERSDPAYSEWLHSKGFMDGNKSFKFFNFSNLYSPERSFDSKRIEIISDTVTMYVSMLSDKTIEHLIIGMFESGKMRIFDKLTEAEFNVKYIETVPEPEYTERMQYKTATPAAFSKKITDGLKEKVYFLEPNDEDYSLYFVKNLLSKYKIYSGIEIADVQDKIELKVLTEAKKEIRAVKSGAKHETKIRGYLYSFELNAPREVQKMIWLSGIGIKNSQGFGFVNLLK